ncbi:MAG: permease prefix domain 1-containing protein, partial [Planctomycetota bacterium]
MPKRLGSGVDEVLTAVHGADPLESWLTVFSRMLRLPEGEARSIRLELEEHLRERVRDLMVDGHREDEAVRHAIEELGETAELARRFQSANRYPTRRLAMNLSLLAVAVGVVGLTTVALRAPGTGYQAVPASVFQETSPEDQIAGLDRPIEARFDGVGIGEVLAYIAEELDVTIVAHWSDLEAIEVTRDDPPFDLAIRSIPVRRLLDLVLEQADWTGDSLAWHFEEGLIELGSRERFDVRDVVLVSYDIGPTLTAMDWEYDIEYDDGVMQITDLLQEMVSPDDWEAMGGQLALLSVVGGKLFIQAPRSMHREIAWILAELAAQASEDEEEADEEA